MQWASSMTSSALSCPYQRSNCDFNIYCDIVGKLAMHCVYCNHSYKSKLETLTADAPPMEQQQKHIKRLALRSSVFNGHRILQRTGKTRFKKKFLRTSCHRGTSLKCSCTGSAGGMKACQRPNKSKIKTPTINKQQKCLVQHELLERWVPGHFWRWIGKLLQQSSRLQEESFKVKYEKRRVNPGLHPTSRSLRTQKLTRNCRQTRTHTHIGRCLASSKVTSFEVLLEVVQAGCFVLQKMRSEGKGSQICCKCPPWYHHSRHPGPKERMRREIASVCNIQCFSFDANVET